MRGNNVRGLTKVVQAGIVISMAINLVEVTLSTILLNLVEKVEAGIDVTGTANLHDMVAMSAGALGIVLFLLVAILTLVWVYKVNENLHQAGIRDLEFSPGWAVGWWFIPLANLVRPYEVIADLWRGSFTRTGSARKKYTIVPISIGIWWGCWLLSGLATRLSAAFIEPDAPSFEDFKNSAYLGITGGALSAIAGFLFIRILSSISSAQEGQLAKNSDPNFAGDQE